MVMTLRENNVGSVLFVDILLGGATKRFITPESKNGSGTGLSKVTRSDNWRAKADIAQGSFTK